MASKDDSPEVVLNLEELLAGLTRAMAVASATLPKALSNVEGFNTLPFTYHMPRMRASVSLSFTYSEGKVKGILRKKTSSSVQEFTSTIELEIVATPRLPGPDQ